MPFIHDHALVESDEIGEGTRIWAFAHVMRGARIGSDCNVCDHTYIEGDVVIGDRVTIKSGVYLWDGMRVADDVFIGPQATFTNDRFPRSRQHFACETITLERGATIGAAAVVLPGVTVGEGAMVGAGAVVTQDVPSRTVVVGNPARVVRSLDPSRAGIA
jgi:UDP-2-acetamido-3-amino-2,3-dideoxy-glucuronate N-acetyltransferase